MNEETKENIDGVVPTNGNVENAFSDLISEYFENDGATASTNTQQQVSTTTLDWDNVNNGQLYTNLAGNNIQNQDTQATGQVTVNNITNNTTQVTAGNIQNDNTIYQNITAQTVQTGDVQCQNVSADTVVDGTNQSTGTTGTGILYTNLDSTSGDTSVEQTTGTTSEAGQVSGYGAIYNDIEGVGTVTPTDSQTTVTSTVDLGGTKIAGTVDTVVNTTETADVDVYTNQTTTGTNVTGTDVTGTGTSEFKLTQANLPAKIGFWTKVRNFFMPEARINYSLQQPTTNTGIWNKVQSFFSFGKNK